MSIRDLVNTIKSKHQAAIDSFSDIAAGLRGEVAEITKEEFDGKEQWHKDVKAKEAEFDTAAEAMQGAVKALHAKWEALLGDQSTVESCEAILASLSDKKCEKQVELTKATPQTVNPDSLVVAGVIHSSCSCVFTWLASCTCGAPCLLQPRP
jgi:hypothetical protein